jgi:hypothetical protein
MREARRSKTKKTQWVTAGLLVVLLLFLPAAAFARGEFFIEFGAGLLTGYLLPPKPIYVAPPAYVLPPQVVQVYPGPGPTSPPAQAPNSEAVPPPPAPPASGYVRSATHPEPDLQEKCREWRRVDKRLEDRWDPTAGKWQQVPVEKWDWVDIPCASKTPPPEARGDAKIEPPPAYSFPATPEVAVIPGTYAYIVPDIGVDILFYQGYWYRPHAGRWFFALSHNGPWVLLAPPRVPHVLLNLPPGYRRLPHGYLRIPHRELQTNWRRWENERHWHSHRGWQEGWRGRPEGRGGEERGRGHEGRR